MLLETLWDHAVVCYSMHECAPSAKLCSQILCMHGSTSAGSQDATCAALAKAATPRAQGAGKLATEDSATMSLLPNLHMTESGYCFSES